MLQNAYFLAKSEPIQPKTSNILPKFVQPTLSDVAVPVAVPVAVAPAPVPVAVPVAVAVAGGYRVRVRVRVRRSRPLVFDTVSYYM